MMSDRLHTITENICLQTIVLCGHHFVTGFGVIKLRMRSYYINFCGQTNHILQVKWSATSTAVNS
jgi:hypothetical protein